MGLPKAITTLCNTNSFPLCRMKLQKHPRHRIQHVDGQEIRVEATLMSLTEVFLFGTHCDLRDFTHFKAIGFIQPSFWVCKHLAPDKWRPYYPHFKGFLTLKALKQIFFLEIGFFFFFLLKWTSCNCRMLDLEEISEIFYIHTHSRFTEKEGKIRLVSLSQEQIFGRAGTMFSDSQSWGWSAESNKHKIWIRYKEKLTLGPSHRSERSVCSWFLHCITNYSEIQLQEILKYQYKEERKTTCIIILCSHQPIRYFQSYQNQHGNKMSPCPSNFLIKRH